MSQGRQAQAVKLSRQERKSLELLTRRGTAQHRQVVRARIALMAHKGETTTAIADAVGVSVQTVSHWRTRLARQGAEGLQEVARPGRPRRIGQTQRLELLALACEPAQAQGRATPTLDELVERAALRGVVKQISRSHLQRILQAGDMRPHRVRQWLESNSLALTCDLYERYLRDVVLVVLQSAPMAKVRIFVLRDVQTLPFE